MKRATKNPISPEAYERISELATRGAELERGLTAANDEIRILQNRDMQQSKLIDALTMDARDCGERNAALNNRAQKAEGLLNEATAEVRNARDAIREASIENQKLQDQLKQAHELGSSLHASAQQALALANERAKIISILVEKIRSLEAQ